MMEKPWIEEIPIRYTAHLTSQGEPYFVHQMADLGNKVQVGRYSYIHGNTRVTGNQSLQIGKFCSIASGVRLHCGDEHDLEHISTFPFNTILGVDLNYHEVRGAGIVIGNDVWIGEGVRILSGAVIGNGSVLGAGGLIKSYVEPYSVYGGNPARLIRKRCSSHKIEMLIKIGWWDWSLDKIKRNKDFFCAKIVNISDIDFDKIVKNIK
jgi:acetyltransferase-like isoleucine patch superfamily enzyme